MLSKPRHGWICYLWKRKRDGDHLILPLCNTLFQRDVQNDSDIFAAVTAVVIIWCGCCWTIFSLFPHNIITHVGRFSWATTHETFTLLVFNNLLPRLKGVQPEKHQQTHLQVKELAVASVDDLCAAIAPGHFDDIDLGKETKTGWVHSSEVKSWNEERDRRFVWH